jgi:hypothetical protein
MGRRKLCSRGDLVKCRPDVEILLLWPRHYSFFNEETVEVGSEQILLVLDFAAHRDNFLQSDNLTDEWKGGAYFVLSSSGEVGWVGQGWVVPL